jgi:hypothetical protein
MMLAFSEGHSPFQRGGGLCITRTRLTSSRAWNSLKQPWIFPVMEYCVWPLTCPPDASFCCLFPPGAGIVPFACPSAPRGPTPAAARAHSRPPATRRLRIAGVFGLGEAERPSRQAVLTGSPKGRAT